MSRRFWRWKGSALDRRGLPRGDDGCDAFGEALDTGYLSARRASGDWLPRLVRCPETRKIGVCANSVHILLSACEDVGYTVIGGVRIVQIVRIESGQSCPAGRRLSVALRGAADDHSERAEERFDGAVWLFVRLSKKPIGRAVRMDGGDAVLPGVLIIRLAVWISNHRADDVGRVRS